MKNTQAHPLHAFAYCPQCGSPAFEPDSPRSKKCRQCGFHYYFNPSAAAAVLIANAKGQLLLTRRAHSPQKGTLDLPGGFAELNETIEDTARREVREELGVELANLRYFASQPNRYPFGGLTVHTLDVFFTATLPPGEETKLRAADDVESYLWLRPEDVDPARVGLESIRAIVAKWKSEQLQKR